jgi:hypothetical protein
MYGDSRAKRNASKVNIGVSTHRSKLIVSDPIYPTNDYIICECENEVVKWEISLPEVAIEIFNRLITYN